MGARIFREGKNCAGSERTVGNQRLEGKQSGSRKQRGLLGDPILGNNNYRNHCNQSNFSRGDVEIKADLGQSMVILKY